MVMNGIFSFTTVLPMVQVIYHDVLKNRTGTNYIQPALNGNTFCVLVEMAD